MATLRTEMVATSFAELRLATHVLEVTTTLTQIHAQRSVETGRTSIITLVMMGIWSMGMGAVQHARLKLDGIVGMEIQDYKIFAIHYKDQ